jgi:CcmD family protein
MVRSFLRLNFLLAMLLTGLISQAQDSLRNDVPQMAEGMRSNGKIYVVVAVLVIILAGLFLYLIQLDRKLTRLEKKQ